MKMKKLLAVILCAMMLVGLLPTAGQAAESNVWDAEHGAPTISVSASELEVLQDADGNEYKGMSVTVSIDMQEGSLPITAYGLGVEYNTTVVEVDATRGDTIGKGANKRKVGVAFHPTCDEDGEVLDDLWEITSNFLANPSRLSVGDTDIFYIQDASAYGLIQMDFSFTYYFKLVDEDAGGAAVLKLTNQKDGSIDLFSVQTNDDAGDPLFAEYPGEDDPDVVTVAIPIPFTTVTVTGEVTTPAKGGTDESDVGCANDYVNVVIEWEPALEKGNDETGAPVLKFAADTEYTAKVIVYATGGAAFTGEETVEYEGKSGLEFEPMKNGDGDWVFVATKTFEKTLSKEITAMEITTPAAKLSGYEDGDAFDTAGMKVKATYDDESVKEDYTDYTVSPETLTKGDATVTITSNEKASVTATIKLDAEVGGKTDEEAFAGEFSPAELTEAYTGEDLTAAFTGSITHTGVDGKVTYVFKSGDDVMKTVVNAGTYDVYASVTGDAHYADLTEVPVATATVTPKALTGDMVSGLDDQTYTGAAIEPVVLTDGDAALVKDTDYTVAYESNTDAGTAKVTVTGKGNYSGTLEETFTILPLEVDAVWANTALTYNRSEQAPTATATDVKGGTMTLTVTGGQTDAGSYTATAASEDGNYTVSEATATTDFTIAKADYEGTLTADATAPAKGVTDKELSVSALGLPETFVDAKVVSAAPAAEAGIVTAAARASDAAVKFSTGAAEDGATGTFGIVVSSRNWNDVPVTVTVTARTLELPENFWDDNVAVAEAVDYGTKDSEAVTLPEGSVSIPDPEGNMVSGTLSLKNEDSVQNAGTATVTVVADFDGTTFEQDFTYEVSPKEVAVVWTNTELTYNGEAQAPTAAAEGVNGETLVLTINGAITDAGDGLADAYIDSVTGGNGEKNNYELTNNVGIPFTIAQKEVVVSGITAGNKTYDGTTDAVLDFSAAVIDGKVEGDDLSVTAEGAFADADAGKGKTVTITGLTLTGEDAANYKLLGEGQQQTATADIDPKVVKFDVSLEKTSVEYNGAEQAPVVTVKDGETVLAADKDYTVSVAPATCKDAGTYTVSVAGAGNYEGSTADDLTYTITPKALTEAMVSGLEDQTYTGAAIEPVTVKDGDTELAKDTDYTITYDGNTDAGTASVTVTGAGNYTGTLNLSFTIKPAEAEVTWTDVELTYTGEAQAPKASAKDLTGKELPLTVTGEQTDAGTYTAAAALDETITNYTLKADTASTEFTIKPAEFKTSVAIKADADPVVEGTTLTADTADAKGDKLSYQWKRDGEAIEGAAEETYKVTADDVGTEITLTVTSAGNYEGELTSEAVKVLGAPAFTSVEASADTESITVSWEIKDNGSPITGITVTVSHEGDEDIVVTVEPTESSVEIEDLDEGETYTVKVTAVNAIGSTDSDPLEVETAVYEEEELFTITVAETEHGKIEVSVSESYAEDRIVVKVTPDEGYELDTLKVVDAAGNPIKVTENKSSYSFNMPESNVKIKATFKSQTGTKPEMPFVDVEEGSVYEDAVYWALESGVTNGTDETHFSPYDPCSRAEAVTFLWRTAECPEPTISECPFEDVTDTEAYYYKAVLWAYENGITKGTSDTTFSPFETVTRAQMITFVYRMSGESAKAGEIPFTDVDADAYYAEAVMWAVSNGVTNGTAADTFSPNEECVRYQVVTFLYRYFK